MVNKYSEYQKSYSWSDWLYLNYSNKESTFRDTCHFKKTLSKSTLEDLIKA